MRLLHSTPFYCAKQFGTENVVLLESSLSASKAALGGTVAETFLTELQGNENSPSGDVIVLRYLTGE